MAYEYQYTETERHWDWTGCSFSKKIPVPKVCWKWGIPYPCGIRWLTVTIPYPCYVTRQVTKIGSACRGRGGLVALSLSDISYDWDEFPDKNQPVADPLDPKGDTLYAIYRKGLITRHITRNGRVLPWVPLEKVNFEPAIYDRSGYINVNHSDGGVVKLPIGIGRYSEEISASTNTPENIMWVPVIAPAKYPGVGNNGYYVVSGDSDNPFYYGGGLALALFSLEAMHKVSKYSIRYARMLVRYFLASEMWEGHGYILRRPGFFNSNRNRNGESIIQGASLEELLGFMLGIMYYLKAEEKENLRSPLYSEAVRLRDDVLRQVSSGSLFSKYKHPFMNSSNDPSYWVKHFEFPLYAPREYRPGGSRHFEWLEQLYISLLTIGSGDTRAGDHWYTPGWIEDMFEFEHYMMFLTSIILVLDGNIPENKKEWFAEVYMRDVIKASVTSGPDIENLKGNLYMSVVGLLASKYLNEQRDCWTTSNKLISIWGDDLGIWQHMIRHASLPQYNALIDAAPCPAGMHWQHNLPLAAISNKDGLALSDDPTLGWVNHNPDEGIGRQFIWRYESKKYVWRKGKEYCKFSLDSNLAVTLDSRQITNWLRRQFEEQGIILSPMAEIKVIQTGSKWTIGDADQIFLILSENQDLGVYKGGVWLEDFPGWENTSGSSVFIDPANQATESDFKTSPCKGYNIEAYVRQELIGFRGSQDNQVEGAGLDLLLIRMLLTHIDDTRFPKPNLPNAYDKYFPILPYVGVEPLSLQFMHNAYRYSSMSDCSPFEIHGDQDESLRIVKLGDECSSSQEFVVAYANEDDTLVLKHGFIATGLALGLYLDSKGTTWRRFDKAILASTKNDAGENIVIVAERAEGDTVKNPLNPSCFLRRTHWLRLSLWRVSPFAMGQDPNPILIDTWEADSRHCGAAKELDMTLLDRKHVAVIFRTQNDVDRIRIFEIGNGISPLINEQVAEEVYNNRIRITATSGNVVIYSRQDSAGWSLWSSKWDNTHLARQSIRSIPNSELLDMTVISNGHKRYLVAVTKQQGYLNISSYEISPDGDLGVENAFHTIDGEEYLVGREADYERASISAFDHVKGGFVIIGKGVAREIRNEDGEWEKTAKGLKIVSGYILDDGRPSIISSNVLGSGESSAMSMLDVTGHMIDGLFHGVISAHKTKNYGGILGMWSKNYLELTFWQYRNPYEDQTWS